MNFNEKLIRTRKERGLSQEALAARINVSRQAISKWELGDAMPDLNNLLLLADALDISLDALCGRESAAPAPQSAPHPRKKNLLLLVLIPLLIVAAILSAYYLNKDTAPSENAILASLSEEFTVTGLSFRAKSTDSLEYSFTPSISGEGLTYEITFDGSFGTFTFDAPCEGGVCSGIAYFGGYNSAMTVTVSVTDGISSRNLAVATNLAYHDAGSSWTSLIE